MAEQFTEAGQIGKDIRSKLGSAVKAAGSGAKWGYNYINDFVTEYGQEPLLNLYPQAVNLFAAGGEVVAGMADKPVNLGRFPYYDLKTQFDKREEQKQAASPVEIQEEVPTITVSKKAEKPKSDLYRVMLKGGDSRKDTFFATEEAAKSALEDERARRKAERDYMVQTLGEAETLKRLGKEEKDIGAIAGVTFPAETKEEKKALELQYMKKSLSGGKTPKAKETEEEAIKRRVREVNPQATPEQQQNYYNTLTASRARGKEREAASKERSAKFRSDIAAKEASSDQLNQYNKQLSALRGAYREARRAGDYVEQYRLGDFINSYQAGVPKEMGARERASRSGMIAQKNKELEEKIRRDREARIAAERASMTNPDFNQFNANQFGQGLTYSKL